MAYRIRRVDYFHATVVDQPGESYKVLSALAGMGSERKRLGCLSSQPTWAWFAVTATANRRRRRSSSAPPDK